MQENNLCYALADANNFYASCEKIFRPDLADIPLVVLSNNDGCIVARSKEAKALGIGMAEPFYKMKDLLEKHKVAIFSSNYALYGDISNRIISILEGFCEEVEQYSIDEAFMRFNPAMIANKDELLESIRLRVLKWLGIQVSIGLGATYTLAKLANSLAKKNNGIYCLDINSANFTQELANIPVSEVWGIGRQSAKKLMYKGITNALQLQEVDDAWVRKNLSVTGWNTVLELRGTPACDISGLEVDELKPRKTLISSRSFAKKITDKKDLEEALSYFAANAAQRLRRENMLAYGIQINIRTAKNFEYKPNFEFYAPSIQYTFTDPTADTRAFLHCVQLGLNEVYKSNIKYAKAGVMLFNLVKSNNYQPSLLSYEANCAKQQAQSSSLMHAIDNINRRFGRNSIKFGSEGEKNAHWHMKQEHKSKSYTSSWHELACANCT